MGGWSRNTAVNHVTRRTSRSPGRSRTWRRRSSGTSSWATERRKQESTFAGIFGLEVFAFFSCMSPSTSQRVAWTEAHMRTRLSLIMSIISFGTSSRFSPASGGFLLGLAVALLFLFCPSPLPHVCISYLWHTCCFMFWHFLCLLGTVDKGEVVRRWCLTSIWREAMEGSGWKRASFLLGRGIKRRNLHFNWLVWHFRNFC